MNSCSQLDSVDTLISSISFYRCLIFSSYQNFILGTGLFKKALSDPPTPPPKYLGNQPSSFATDFKWILLHDFTLLNLGDGRHFEMIFSERLTFFWNPVFFVGRGTYKDRDSDIITLNWSLLKSTYVWGHCAVQIVSWLVLHGGASQKF